MSQLVQISGSLLVLTAFALGQRGLLDQRSRAYLVLNLAGSTVLAAEAVRGRLWGFLLLEGVWALVSAIGLFQVLRSPANRSPARSTGR
jgi:hypothetical protein